MSARTCADLTLEGHVLLGLRISNLAVIDELELTFFEGLTVLTGETGAGKSILLDALSLLLGGRADPDVVRAGCEEALIEGTLKRTAELSARLEALGLPDLGEEISLRRVVGRSGRGKAYVNGSLVTVGVLTRLTQGVVEMAGQHAHMGLLDPGSHLSLLDRWACVDDPLRRYREKWQELSHLAAQMQALGGDEREALQRMELLRFQADALGRLSPQAGEEEALELERRRLSSAGKLARAAIEAEAALAAEEGAALTLLHRAAGVLSEAVRLDPALSSQLSAVASCIAEVEAASRALARYGEKLEVDPQRLSEIEERLDALKRLSRIHGVEMNGLVGVQAQLLAELEVLEHRAERLQVLESARTAVRQEARQLAADLTDGRKEAALRFGADVEARLSELSMAGVRLEVRVEPLPELGPDGADRVELYLSANPGEPLRPLAKVASGGEASRVLLALKRAQAETAPGSACVLDEADSGVSGAVAEVVGRMIKEISTGRQVLCITHLPQVAAYADQHWLIQKECVQGKVRSRVVPLEREEDRAEELARLLSGVALTPEAVGAAKALLRGARGGRASLTEVKKERRGSHRLAPARGAIRAAADR